MSLLTGLTTYYKLDENSGSSVKDSAGNNNGTWNGTLGSQWTPGIINSGGNFNGTDNYVDLGKFTGFLPSLNTGAFAVSFWIKTNSVTNINRYILGSLNTGNTEFFGIVLNRNASGGATLNDIGIFIRDGNNNFYNAGTTNPIVVNDNVLHHIVVMGTPSAFTLSVYVDGVSQPTSTNPSGTIASFSNFNFDLFLGARNNFGSTDGFFPGIIDEVALWTRLLQQTEIASLYLNGAGLQTPFGLLGKFFVAPTLDFISTTLKGAVSSGSTYISLATAANLQIPGVVVLDRTNTSTPPTSTPSLREVIGFTSIVSVNILQNLTRGMDGSVTVAHSDGSLVESVWTTGMWNSLSAILSQAFDTQGLLQAIPSPVSIAYPTTKTYLNVSGASVTGFGFVSVFTSPAAYSGPTIAIAGLYVAPRAGTLRWVSAMTKYVASGTSVGFDFQIRGASAFANATMRPAITAGGTFVSTASLSTTNINAGDIIQADVASLLSGAGLIQEISVQGGIT